jgi:hypothetical protein
VASTSLGIVHLHAEPQLRHVATSGWLRILVGRRGLVCHRVLFHCHFLYQTRCLEAIHDNYAMKEVTGHRFPRCPLDEHLTMLDTTTCNKLQSCLNCIFDPNSTPQQRAEAEAWCDQFSDVACRLAAVAVRRPEVATNAALYWYFVSSVQKHAASRYWHMDYGDKRRLQQVYFRPF